MFFFRELRHASGCPDSLNFIGAKSFGAFPWAEDGGRTNRRSRLCLGRGQINCPLGSPWAVPIAWVGTPGTKKSRPRSRFALFHAKGTSPHHDRNSTCRGKRFTRAKRQIRSRFQRKHTPLVQSKEWREHKGVHPVRQREHRTPPRESQLQVDLYCRWGYWIRGVPDHGEGRPLG